MFPKLLYLHQTQNRKIIMKKLLLFVVMFVMSVSLAFAQDDGLKFMDIPIDGPKSKMIKKLQEKGFKYNKRNDYLTGTFNGENVVIIVEDNREGKVWRICILDVPYQSKRVIKTRFNNLLNQFENDSKYIKNRGEKIPEDEEINSDKKYDALFYQNILGEPDINSFVRFMVRKINDRYSIWMFYEN